MVRLGKKFPAFLPIGSEPGHLYDTPLCASFSQVFEFYGHEKGNQFLLAVDYLFVGLVHLERRV